MTALLRYVIRFYIDSNANPYRQARKKVLEKVDIIGCTTNGAAKLTHLLKVCALEWVSIPQMPDVYLV
jgi:hypothetical protein